MRATDASSGVYSLPLHSEADSAAVSHSSITALPCRASSAVVLVPVHQAPRNRAERRAERRKRR